MCFSFNHKAEDFHESRVLLLSMFVSNCVCYLFRNTTSDCYELFDGVHVNNFMLPLYINRGEYDKIMKFYKSKSDTTFDDIEVVMNKINNLARAEFYYHSKDDSVMLFRGEINMYYTEFLEEFNDMFTIIRKSGNEYLYKLKYV